MNQPLNLQPPIEEIKKQLKGLFHYIIALVKHPLDEIKHLPEDVGWRALLVFQFCLSFFSVVFSNLLAPFAISVTHVIISLLTSLVAIALVSLFLYYFFLIIFHRTFPFIKIYSLVLFSHIPFAIFHLASYFFPPSDLIGLGLSGMLMVTGLIENFKIEQKLASRPIIILYLIILIYWSIHIFTVRKHLLLSKPQDLDKIEKELNESMKETGPKNRNQMK